MLIHEYRHAYDYFTVIDYIEVTTENEIERYLYEMDASLWRRYLSSITWWKMVIK